MQGRKERTIYAESFVSVRRRGLGSGPVCTARLTDRHLRVGVPLTRLRLAVPVSDISRVVVDDGATLVRLHVWYLNDTDGGGIRLLVRNPQGWIQALRSIGVDVAGGAEVRDRWNGLMGLGCRVASVLIGAGIVTLIVLGIRSLAA